LPGPSRSAYDRDAVITTRLLCVSFALAACASPMTALREDNRRLSRDVAELRADRRAQDRKLRDLEHQLALAREHGAQDAAIPQLPVEVVAPTPPPGASRVVGYADDGTEIVYEGDAALGRAATIEDEPPRRAAPAPPNANPNAPRVDDVPTATDRIEVTHRAARPVTRTRAPHAHVEGRDSGAVADYRAAVELVRTGKLDDGITALRAFLAHNPHHDYADNARYWIGEAYYARKDFEHALVEFRATIETYPRGNKVPDALLKVGYCYQALGQRDKARAVLEQVVNLYPQSEPAALARKRLESS
jgi:tol-pal system protein YbgF